MLNNTQNNNRPLSLRIKETESLSEKGALLAHYQKYATNFSKRLAQLVIKCRVTAVELKAAGKLPAEAIEWTKLAGNRRADRKRDRGCEVWQVR